MPDITFQFLGVSGMFHSTNPADKEFCSNMAIKTETGKYILIDAGYDIMFSLQNAGISPNDVEYLLLTHLHSDHAGGLEWLIYWKFFVQKSKLKIIMANGLCDDFMKLTNHLQYVTDQVSRKATFSVADMCDIMALIGSIGIGGLLITPVAINHVVSKIRVTSMPAYAFIISSFYTGKFLFYSGDTGNDLTYIKQINMAAHDPVDAMGGNYEPTYIFQECEWCPEEKMSKVHTNIHVLKRDLPDEWKDRTFLYHMPKLSDEDQKSILPMRVATTDMIFTL